jgi:hypothetical protein
MVRAPERLACDMTDEQSPWSRPDTEVVFEPAAGTQSPITTPATASAAGSTARFPAAAGGYKSGNVTGLAVKPPAPPPDVIFGGPDDEDDDPVKRNRRIMKWLGGAAAAVVIIGLVIAVSLVATGHTPGGGLLGKQLNGPSDTRPELAKRCPPPSDTAEKPYNEPPAAPPGPRTSDGEAGISYKSYGAPWSPWDAAWIDKGELKVTYRIGQHFITEPRYNGISDYQATILSGHVPAAVNDGLVLDLNCIGHQVAADLRLSFYPENNSQEMIKDGPATLGGRSAWVLKFRLHFTQPGLKAKSELVSIALIDLGRPEAAILYVSIPDTHPQYEYITDDALDSIRPL